MTIHWLRGHARRTVALGLASAFILGCDAEAPTQPATLPPPEPPTVTWNSSASNTFDGVVWTYNVLIDPRDVPTTVMLEIGAPIDGPVFDQSITVAEGLVKAGPATFRHIAARDDGPCARFTVTNEIGRASTDRICIPAFSFPPRPSGASPAPNPAPSD
jgi:hypothetical protein